MTYQIFLPCLLTCEGWWVVRWNIKPLLYLHVRSHRLFGSVEADYAHGKELCEKRGALSFSSLAHQSGRTKHKVLTVLTAPGVRDASISYCRLPGVCVGGMMCATVALWYAPRLRQSI